MVNSIKSNEICKSVLYKKFSAIILAAGKGSRMLSNIPKVMHKIGGKYILQHIIDTVIKIGVRAIYIVYSSKDSSLISMIRIDSKLLPIYWVEQKELLGTGHAVQQALSIIYDDNEEILILNGDIPLISCKMLKKLRMVKLKCDISLLTAILINPAGYGRIIRNQKGNIVSIIEDNDIIFYNDKKIREVNVGVFIVVSGNLRYWLKELVLHRIKNEFYLTDIISIAYNKGYMILNAMQSIDTFEIMGINSKVDLVYLDKKYQEQQAKHLLSMGVMISDPNRFDLRGTLVCGRDVCIDINVIIEGNVSLGDRVRVDANCILKDTVVKDDVIIYPFSIIEGAIISCKSRVGPFARLRSSTVLGESSHVGNFVELKNISLGNRSKVKHLSYLGDAKVGSQVNIGAGTITCNYDGMNKSQTIIDDNVFVGSDSQLIAPLTIGKNAIIGAGTTVTRDVEENSTVISRVRQFPISNLKRERK